MSDDARDAAETILALQEAIYLLESLSTRDSPPIAAEEQDRLAAGLRRVMEIIESSTVKEVVTSTGLS